MMPNQPSDTERAYLAGLLDGEGSIARHVQSPTCTTWDVYITNTDPAMLSWVKLYFGGSIDAHDKRHLRNPRHKQVYRWHVRNRADVLRVLGEVLPFLVTKCDRAEECIAALEAWTPKQIRRSEWITKANVKRRES